MSVFLASCIAQLVAVAQLAPAAATPIPPALVELGVCVGLHCAEPVQTQVRALLALTTTHPQPACAGAFMLINAHREPGLPTGSYGAPLTRMEILNAGIAELAAQGLLRSLEAETNPHSGLFPPGQLCWLTLTGLGVQYDHERSLAAYEHAPSLWDAVVAWNKRVRGIEMQLRFSVMMFAGIFGVPPSEQCSRDLDKAGGFDFMFEVLQQNASQLILMQAAWAGLSDNVENTRVGAELVADKGGTGKGLEFLISLLPAYRGKHAYQPHMQFGLRYESIHDIAGILMHDDEERTWQKIAAKAGFMEEAIVAMQDEPQDHLTQENGCEAVALMGKGNAENLARLGDLGAVELMAAAVSTFKNAPNDGYYHLNSCSSGLILFAQEGPEFQDRMLELGLLDSMEASMPFWRNEAERRDPWGSRFPWSDVVALQQILMKRRQETA
mmetsp:Transcript_26352/g.61462  ORF Transcript_26352/g.61462 Transcript_26352/m.61462 type:complete len:440 (+) Transcript_26352:79-1398(+)